MSSSLLLVLIIVVWIFVLAPLVINRREPIRRTSEGLGETRLVHRGGEELTARRRPRLTAGDVRDPGERDDDLETVDAEPDDIDGLLIDDEPPVKAAVPAGEGTVVEGDVVLELEPADAPAGSAVADAPADEVTATVTPAPAADSVPIRPLSDLVTDTDATADVNTGAGAGEDEGDVAKHDAGDDDGLDIPVTAGDHLISRERRTAEEKMAARTAAAETAKAEKAAESEATEAADTEAADTEDAAEPADTDDMDLHRVDDELTDDDYAFAASHRGRGGFDPIAARHYAETRFERRKRTVLGLAGALVVALIIGVVAGGGWWALPAAVALLTVAYLVTLRRTVIAEQELQARRIASLKRRRMGVRSREAEELGVPERLRRPGAIVVELDDEDPDFADIPFTDDSGFDGFDDDRHASGM